MFDCFQPVHRPLEHRLHDHLPLRPKRPPTLRGKEVASWIAVTRNLEMKNYLITLLYTANNFVDFFKNFQEKKILQYQKNRPTGMFSPPFSLLFLSLFWIQSHNAELIFWIVSRENLSAQKYGKSESTIGIIMVTID